MKYISTYKEFESYANDVEFKKMNFFDNTPFYGSSEITSSPGSMIRIEKEKESDGKEPQIPVVLKKKKKKRPQGKVQFKIDQDDSNRYMDAQKGDYHAGPGKAFGVGT